MSNQNAKSKSGITIKILSGFFGLFICLKYDNSHNESMDSYQAVCDELDKQFHGNEYDLNNYSDYNCKLDKQFYDSNNYSDYNCELDKQFYDSNNYSDYNCELDKQFHGNEYD